MLGFLVALAATQGLANQSHAPTVARSRALRQYIHEMGPFGLSAAVLVAQRDTILVWAGDGWSDRERNVRIHPGTIFSLGSVSKQFTATAVLKLEMQGKLHVTDSLGRFFPDLPPDKVNITLHQLLTHTAGVSSSESGRACLSRSAALRAIVDSPLQFAPGARYRYSNAGYNLLAIVVEVVAGEPFEQFVRRELWDPAGMSFTGFTSDSGRWSDTLVARGYNVTVPYTPYAPSCQWNRKGSAGVLSTVGDLFRWSRALDRGVILSPAAVRKLFTPNVAVEPGTSYGYGWNIARTPSGTMVAYHGGDLLPDGFHSYLLRYADDSVTVVIASNLSIDLYGSQTEPLKDGIEAILFGGSYARPPAVGRAAHPPLSPYVGDYQLPNGGRFEVRADHGALSISAEGQIAIDALVQPTPSRWDSTHAAHFNLLAHDAIEGASRGDTAWLRNRLGEAGNPAVILAAWTELTGTKGRPDGIEVLGTVPLYAPGPTTYVRIRFPGGVSVYRIWWDEDGNFAAMHDGVTSPAVTTLFAVDDRRFVGYDMYYNFHRVPVRFAFAGDGRVTGVEIGTANGVVHASRSPLQ